MWCAISKFCTNTGRENSGDTVNMSDMDRGEDKKKDMELQDTYDATQSKHRASVKWLLSKAFNNRVPENLQEPFYRDHENQEHLKPLISSAMANAELYCLALGHIYSDPNYNNLNHSTILLTLARKGVYDQDNPETQITETILIQTNPLRMNAHMTVIESIMNLYAKEVASSDQISAAIQRIGQSSTEILEPENGLLNWVNAACNALRQRIEQDLNKEENINGDSENHKLYPPKLPKMSSLKDLSDGVALAALVSFYCPDDVPWKNLIISRYPTVSESLHNLMLVLNFCQRNLPCSVFHMIPEDITYMRGSMKQNLIVFLADLFNVLEIHPVKCVRYPGMDRSSSVPRNVSIGMALKKTLAHQSGSDFSEDSLFRRDSEENFIVHRNRTVPTLSSMVSAEEPLIPARLRPSKEKQNNDSKAEERGDLKQTAAGKPSNWEDSRKNSYAGRRSRRNSFSEESQLTIENFGGSQEHLNFIGRNPDKDFATHSGKKVISIEPSIPARSSIQDARGSIQIAYEEYEKKDEDMEKNIKIQSSNEILSKQITNQDENIVKDMIDGEINNKFASFADLSKTKVGDPKGIHIVYMQHEKEDSSTLPTKSSLLSKKNNNTNGTGEKKTTTFATLPNTTTWQQQSSSHQQTQKMQREGQDEENGGSNIMASQLNNIRMKLEEKRRHIESEKRRMELIMNKQRQKVGKAAFLQAVTKSKSNLMKGSGGGDSEGEVVQVTSEPPISEKPQRPFSLKEISEDAQSVEQKWLDSHENSPFVETRKTPDIESMDLEQYQQSLAIMNSSLHDIQADIQRLATQQNQIQHQNIIVQQQQQLQALAAQHQQHLQHYASQHNIAQQQSFSQIHQMFGSASHIPQRSEQFYLHDQPQQRRTWTQPGQPVPPARTYPHQSEIRTWDSKPQTYSQQHLQDMSRHQNGDQSITNNHLSYTLNQQSPYPGITSPLTSSPQHRNIHRQISHLMSDSLDKSTGPVNLKQMEHQDRTLSRSSSVIHAPVPVPSVDDMEPQNISFIGNSDDALSEGLNRLNITSGSRTYRIPSPTRPSISRNSFQHHAVGHESPKNSDTSDNSNEKGFYISFDNEQPKRPKPPLRVKRGSPKKEKSGFEEEIIPTKSEPLMATTPVEHEKNFKQINRESERFQSRQNENERSRPISRESPATPVDDRLSREKSPSAIIIGSEPDPNSLDEMEKKKERIMLLSLQRRQQQEEAKARKEADAVARREQEKAKEEERARKKEEQVQRRAAILEQYKLKKAIEEAEREGKILDKSELMGSMKPTPKLRGKTTGRPRPKTIHVDSGSVELAEGMLTPSRGKKGSTSNLTSTNTYNPSSMRRDYYRGSHDSLADAGISGSSLYRDNVQETGQVRGRPKYSTYQNFKAGGRKSNSMMNLCGSSSDQDSMVYRYGDTDSGLGRATPPRRAPSPGMGPMRHLPSPSGPGSLPPGLMTKRRMFDDGCSDISSTPSSMMDYSGPRLYKQPTTKSNRGIMLNAVEYCVFPGVVNKEAKRRVLEEIARSESKHFLILFRDAGCQFRALYSYCPEREDVMKLYGTGPKQVNDRMFDKFFKYNSGGKCFSQVHTKHLTVTIDAFTIHNSLWQGKKVNLPNKKDMALVI